ncbi:MAG: HesA/MoeB/ThiF family protein [Pikeienuella sp.]
MTRYIRQIILPEVGEEGQNRLSTAHALIIGAGGLGAPVIQYLAGAGIGHLTIVDPDVVDKSNLHRQTIFTENRIGQSKAKAATTFAKNLNSNIATKAIVDHLNPNNISALLNEATIALDCADSFAVSYILSDACLNANIPLISASALGLSGYVGGFCGGAPSLRAVFPDLPDQAANCATAGVLGPVVGTLGAMQAQMALTTILSIEPSPLGCLTTFDGKTMQSGGFRFDNAPEPETALRFIAPETITKDDFVVELRDEAPTPIRPNALRTTADQFGPDGPRPASGQRAVMVCRSGLRAWAAASRLTEHWQGEVVLVAVSSEAASTDQPEGTSP